VALSATARVFRIGKQDKQSFGAFCGKSRPLGEEEESPRCVVVGKWIMRVKTPVEEIMCYVLLITLKKSDSPRGEKLYERVGVSYIAGKFIDLVGNGASGLVNVQ
jgi:hypothetical protein